MIIKDTTRTINLHFIQRLSSKKLRTALGILTILSILGCFTVARLYTSNVSVRKKIAELKLATLTKWKYQLTAQPEIAIDLEINFENLSQLRDKRDQAMETGVLISSDEDFVSAVINRDGDKTPVKIRLKGDWLDHLKDDDWSFRVHTKNNHTFLGMSRFSLQKPSTRNNLNEWIFLEAVKAEGLVGLQYDFLDLSINGEPKGIYAIEEHFTKELLERNHRREAPIIKFNEDDFWQTISDVGGQNNVYKDQRPNLVEGMYYESFIEPFQLSTTRQDDQAFTQAVTAVSRLNRYRDGRLDPETLFDFEQLSSYLALTDIFGARHSWQWHNLRFYVNPVTGKLEPIPFDNMPGDIIEHLSIESPMMEVFSQLQDNENFMRLYAAKLATFSDPTYLDELWKQYEQQIVYYQSLLRKEQPEYTLLFKPFYENGHFITQNLNLNQSLKIFTSPQGAAYIDVYNTSAFPLTITSVEVDQSSYNLDPVLILPSKIGQPINTYTIKLPISISHYQPENFKFYFSIPDSQNSYHSTLASLPQRSLTYSQPTPLNPHLIPYDRRTNCYQLQGQANLSQSISFPSGSCLFIAAGTSVELSNANLIINGPLYSMGTEELPVTISSPNHDSGLLITTANQTSTISHTTFEGLTNINTNGHTTTGGVTFYLSPVSISESHFQNSQSEDALNIIRSDFDVQSITITDSLSDALDVDFSHGSITSARIINTGNDGIDFSGSQVDVYDVKIISYGDKGFSVGENSYATIDASEIISGNIGVASKDLSQVFLDGVTIRDVNIGLAAYQKKPEFGAATIHTAVLNQINNTMEHLIEKRSILIKPGEIIPGEANDVAIQLQ